MPSLTSSNSPRIVETISTVHISLGAPKTRVDGAWPWLPFTRERQSKTEDVTFKCEEHGKRMIILYSGSTQLLLVLDL